MYNVDKVRFRMSHLWIKMLDLMIPDFLLENLFYFLAIYN